MIWNYRESFSCSEVEEFVFLFAAVVEHSFDGNNVCTGDIYNVDIVADAATVGGVINPFPNTFICERLPIAVCVTIGKRLSGAPTGYSPILAVACAPTGLK